MVYFSFPKLLVDKVEFRRKKEKEEEAARRCAELRAEHEQANEKIKEMFADWYLPDYLIEIRDKFGLVLY